MTQAVLLGLVNAFLITAGIFFQKLNGVKGGSAVISGWLALSLLCFAPTFWVGNVAIGRGRVAPFLATSALFYVFTTTIAKVVFGEPVGPRVAAGLGLIVVGIALVVSGAGPTRP